MPRRFDVDKDGFLILPPGFANMMTAPRANGISRLTGSRQSVGAVAGYLARQLQQPVVDETALSGIYDFHLVFARDGRAASAPDDPSALVPYAPDPAPTLVQAVEGQLGLKMVAKCVKVDCIAIDHVERQPVEN